MFDTALRRKIRQNKYLYKWFVQENKNFWMWYNLTLVCMSLMFGFGTYFILITEKDCPSLRTVLWATIGYNLLNTGIGSVNLTGSETDICNFSLVCILFLLELVMLSWMQISYFESQACIEDAASMYFWLMA